MLVEREYWFWVTPGGIQKYIFIYICTLRNSRNIRVSHVGFTGLYRVPSSVIHQKWKCFSDLVMWPLAYSLLKEVIEGNRLKISPVWRVLINVVGDWLFPTQRMFLESITASVTWSWDGWGGEWENHPRLYNRKNNFTRIKWHRHPGHVMSYMWGNLDNSVLEASALHLSRHLSQQPLFSLFITPASSSSSSVCVWRVR